MGTVLTRGGREGRARREGVHEQEEVRQGGCLDVSDFLSSPVRLQGREQVPSAERANALTPQGEEVPQLRVRG